MRAGDFVEISRKGNTVVLQPKRVVDADDVLTDDEAKLVRGGEA